MRRTTEEIINIIQKPEYEEQIRNAVFHSARVRLHFDGLSDQWHRWKIGDFLTNVDPVLKKGNTAARNNYYNAPGEVLLKKMINILPADKFLIALSQLEIPTTSLIDAFCKEVQRIFEADGETINFEFTNDNLKVDWNNYRQVIADKNNGTGVSDREYWQTVGVKSLFSNFNSIIICDHPPIDLDEKIKYSQVNAIYNQSLPEPYFYLLPIEAVKDVKASIGGIEYLIFKDSKDNYVWIDAYRYVIVSSDCKEATEMPDHNLGQCPAQWFSNNNRYDGNFIEKASIITKHLDLFEDYCIYETDRKHLGYFARNPILWKYEEGCDYKCYNGYRTRKYFQDEKEFEITEICECQNKKIAGAGTVITMPMPHSKETAVNPPPAGFINVDVAALDYTLRESELIRDKIVNVLRGGGNVIADNNVALNTTHVTASLEDRKAVLMSLKNLFEIAWKFAVDLCATWRYGNLFIGSQIILGDEFFLKTEAEYQTEYTEAKAAGMPQSSLDAIWWKIIKARFRNNPHELERQRVIMQLEPFRHYKQEELTLMLQNGIIGIDEYRYSVKFMQYFLQFERSLATNIVNFAANLTFDKKIELIKKQLTQYAKQDEYTRSEQSTGTA